MPTACSDIMSNLSGSLYADPLVCCGLGCFSLETFRFCLRSSFFFPIAFGSMCNAGREGTRSDGSMENKGGTG